MSYPIKTRLVKALTMLFLLALPALLHAQPPGGDCDYMDPMADCPIDGGVAALLVIGAAYGVKRINPSKIKNEEKA